MATRTPVARPSPGLRHELQHPRSIPILASSGNGTITPESDPSGFDQPFAEGSQDGLDSDLRYRLISDAAYRRYTERGYADGHDVEDWLQAEADIDHLLINGATRHTRRRSGGA